MISLTQQDLYEFFFEFSSWLDKTNYIIPHHFAKCYTF